MSVALIDYGAGNISSVRNALLAAGASQVDVTADPDTVATADRIVLPGVGAFAACIAALRAVDGMVEALTARVIGHGTPFLGICVGMQLLARAGVEHGRHPGLGWIEGEVRAIVPTDPAIKVPHMGWNRVTPTDPTGPVAAGEAYFLHGYHFVPDDAADIIARTDHGGPLVAAVARGNIIGVQFHPEKSQGYGLAFLSDFLEWRP